MHEAGRSVDGIRDLAHHHERRRLWTRAMNSTNMKHYEDPLRNCLNDFVTSLSERQGETVDLTEWVTFFGYVLILNGHSTFAQFRCVRFEFMGHIACVSINYLK